MGFVLRDGDVGRLARTWALPAVDSRAATERLNHTRAVREHQARTVVAAVTGVQTARSTGERDAPLTTAPMPMNALNVVNPRARARAEPLPRRTRTAPVP